MEATFGWVLLSRERLAQAARVLEAGGAGVLDELGLLEAHRAFSQRFFPGTSVLHTRLRYALFVPWIYQDLERNPPSNVRSALRRAEHRLTGKLLLGAGSSKGVIGGTLYAEGKSPQALSCDSYWGAIQSWGIAPRERGQALPRRTVHSRLRRQLASGGEHDEDGARILGQRVLFPKLPPRPEGWNDPDVPLDFELAEDERHFLRERLLSTQDRGAPSLFSCLVSAEAPSAGVVELYDEEVREAAGTRLAGDLDQAQSVAHLGGILRGVYAALVEEACERDGLSPGRRHRRRLGEIAEEDRELALRCSVPELPARKNLRELLREGQAWLEAGGHVESLAVSSLARKARLRERRLKGVGRVRLGESAVALRMRSEWDASKFPLARPLHYRWAWVRRLLLDLRGADPGAPSAEDQAERNQP
jgi:hypothetical protein